MNYFPFPKVNEKLTVAFSNKEEKFDSLLTRLNLTEEKLVGMWQVHGDKIVWVEKGELGQRISDTDGLVTNEADVFLAVRVADCVAVLFFDPKNLIVATAHCGWRGVMNGLAGKMVDEMVGEGSKAEDILVSFGPSARSCCYVIQEVLANQFAQKFGEDVVEKRESKSFLSLQKTLTKQLVEKGISASNIFDSGICTIHNSEKFHSFRADKQKGHNVAIIGLRS